MRGLSENEFKYVRLLGGLGNNLFQLALGYHLNDISNSRIRLFRISRKSLNQYQESSWDPKQNDLDVSGLIMDSGVFDRFDSRCLSNRVSESLFTPGSQFRNLIKLKRLKTLVVQNDPCWLPTKDELKTYDVFSGYFQNAQLVREVPHKFFSFLTNYGTSRCDKGFIEHAKNYDICIQVRRGDYRFHADTIGMLDDHYFIKAVENFGLNVSGAKVLILTDEPQACESLARIFPRSKIYGPDQTDTLTTLMIMAYSNSLAISNSSLGWWGGFLAQRGGARVLAPFPWKVRGCANHDANALMDGLEFNLQKSTFV